MKKRSILSILLVFVMIAALCLFVGCGDEETDAKIDEAVVDAVAQATEKIDAAKAALETAIAAKADTATVTTKIEELNAAIAAAKADAATADAALKTEIEAAIAAAQKAATDAAAANLETAKAELTAAIAAKADTTTVNTKVTELTAAIEAAKKAATDADAALKTELTGAITAAAQAAATNLANAVNTLNTAIATKADAATLTAKTEELAAAVEAAKKAATDADTALKNNIDTKIEQAIATLGDAYLALGDWNATTEDVIKYLDNLQSKYTNLTSKAQALAVSVYTKTVIRLYRATDKVAAKAIFDFADKTFDAIITVSNTTYPQAYYYAAEQAEIEGLITDALVDVLALDFATGDDADDVNKVVTDLNNAIAAVETKADKIEAILTAEGNTAAVVILSDAWKNAIDAAATKLAAEEALFEDTASGIPAVVELYKTLSGRYTALVAAKADADRINAAIVAYAAKLNSEYKVITSDFVTDFEAIETGVATWKTTYFTGFAQEGENWNMLDHTGYATVKALYDDQIGVLITLAEAANEAIKKLGTVTIRSGLDIEEAKAAYRAFTDRLGDLEFAIGTVPTSGELTTATTRAEAEFIKICRDAIAAYLELAVVTEKIDTTNVTIYDGAAVAALVEWYATYFNVDVADANSTLNIATSLTITDGARELTFVEENLTAAKALKAAFDTLETAKKAETQSIIDAIAALKPAISNRTAADAAQAARKAWINGTNAPAGFTAAQFAIDETNDTYVIVNYSELKSIRNAIKALETRYAELSTKPGNLTKVEVDLVDATVRAEYAAYVAMIEADMAQLIADNCGEDPFTTEHYALIETAKVEMAQGAAIEYVTDNVYAPVTEIIEYIDDVRVYENLFDRADDALAAAIAHIKTIISTDPAAFVSTYDELDLIKFTAEKYIEYVGDHPYSVDELFSAVQLLSGRVSNGLIAELQVEKNFVVATFDRAVSDSILVYPDGELPDVDYDEI